MESLKTSVCRSTLKYVGFLTVAYFLDNLSKLRCLTIANRKSKINTPGLIKGPLTSLIV
jgi:hypothetical protein